MVEVGRGAVLAAVLRVLVKASSMVGGVGGLLDVEMRFAVGW